jgi:hypothetical protein
MTDQSTKVFYSRAQRNVFYGGAIVFALAYLDEAIRAGGIAYIPLGILAVATTVMLMRGAYTQVEAGAGGIRVVNYFGSNDLRWDQIDHFEIGRRRNLGSVLLIKLRSGEVEHAFGIQEMNYDKVRKRHPAVELAEALNAELQHRDPRRPAEAPTPGVALPTTFRAAPAS